MSARDALNELLQQIDESQQSIDRKINERLAAALRTAASYLDDGTDDPVLSKPKPAASRKHNAAATATKQEPKIATNDQVNWRRAEVHGRKDPSLTNTYRILLDEYGTNQFDTRDARTKAFRPALSLAKMNLEMKMLQNEGLARPLDDLRLHWILERV